MAHALGSEMTKVGQIITFSCTCCCVYNGTAPHYANASDSTERFRSPDPLTGWPLPHKADLANILAVICSPVSETAQAVRRICRRITFFVRVYECPHSDRYTTAATVNLIGHCHIVCFTCTCSQHDTDSGYERLCHLHFKQCSGWRLQSNSRKRNLWRI